MKYVAYVIAAVGMIMFAAILTILILAWADYSVQFAVVVSGMAVGLVTALLKFWPFKEN